MRHIFVSFKDLKSASKSNKRKFFGIIAAYVFLAFFIFVAGVFIYFAKDLPSPGKMNNRVVVESTKIYDRTGQHILYEIHGEEKRTIIPFRDIPDSVKYATLALEDQDFYSHHGIKFSSIIRAALKDVFKGSVSQGGSTITQQFIKKSMLTDERTFSRKIKEVILALELETK
jgi:penicillin-binding protein 1A